MANPVAQMIGWFFKQGMAAVALDEKLKALDSRMTTLEGRLEARIDHLDEKIDLVRNELSAKIDGYRGELTSKLDGLRGEMHASVAVHERIAALEALIGRKSA